MRELSKGTGIANIFVSVGAEIGDFQRNMNTVNKTVGKFSKTMERQGRALTKYVTVPLTALGAIAWSSAQKIDDAMDNIRIGTGATGKVLAGLENSFRSVAKKAPSDLAEVSKAITDLNTRLGITGQPLEDLATDSLNVSRMLKTDLGETIRGLTQVMGTWRVENSKGSQVLNMMFAASQKTGAGINALSESVAQYAPILQTMGFGLEESIALLSSFEREGVDAGAIMTALRSSWAQFTKAGMKPTQALEAVIKGIANAKDESKAGALALQYFGARAGVQMARAIRSGRFEISALVEELKNSQDAVKSASDDTWGFQERWAQFKNRTALAIQPLGDSLLKLAETWLPKVEAAIESLTKWFNNLSPGMRDVITVVGIFIAMLGPLLMMVGSIAGAVTALTLPIAGVVAAIAGIAAAAVLVWKNWDKIAGWINRAKEKIVAPFKWIGRTVSAIFGKMRDDGDNSFKGMGGSIAAVSRRTADQTTSVWTKLGDWFSNVWKKIADSATGLWEGIKTAWKEQWDKIKKWLEDNVPKELQNPVSLVLVFTVAFKLVQEIATAIGNWIESLHIQEAIEEIKVKLEVCASWVITAVKEWATILWVWIDENITSRVVEAGKMVLNVIAAWTISPLVEWAKKLWDWLKSNIIPRTIEAGKMALKVIAQWGIAPLVEWAMILGSWLQKNTVSGIFKAGDILLKVFAAWAISPLAEWAKALGTWIKKNWVAGTEKAGDLLLKVLSTWTIAPVAEWVKTFGSWLQKNIVSGTAHAGDIILSVIATWSIVKPLLAAAKAIKAWLDKNKAPDLFPAGETALAVGIKWAFSFVGSFVNAVKKWWDESSFAEKVAVGTVTAGITLSWLFAAPPIAAAVGAWLASLIPEAITAPSAIGVLIALAAAFTLPSLIETFKTWWANSASGILSNIQALVTPLSLVLAIGAGFKFLWDGLKSAWDGWWKGAKTAITSAIEGLLPSIAPKVAVEPNFGDSKDASGVASVWGQIIGFAASAVATVKGMGTEVWNTLKGMGTNSVSAVSTMITGILALFTSMYDVAVGHSIIPDMVEEIEAWIAKLPNEAVGYVNSFMQQILGSFGITQVEGQTIWESFMTGIVGKTTESVGLITDKFKELGSNASTELQSLTSSMQTLISSTFSNLATSLINGQGDTLSILTNFLNQALTLILTAAINAILATEAVQVALKAMFTPGGLAIIAGALAAVMGIMALINSKDPPPDEGSGGGEEGTPKMASGGIVTRRTKAIIGEAGPEAIVPLRPSVLAAMGGGGGGIVVNVYEPRIMSDRDMEAFGEKLVTVLRRKGVRG